MCLKPETTSSPKASIFQTSGTRQTWSNFGEWMHIAQFHLEWKPDGTHKCRSDQKGAKRHIKALLETDLIEQCDDRALLEQAHEFFNSIQRSNFSFCKRENPPELRSRIHNQIQRLQSGRPLPRTVTPMDRNLALQTFVSNARIEGPNNQGIWQPGMILHADRHREFCVIRFDDDSFIQKPIVKLLQQGFTLSSAPKIALERIEFQIGDRVRVKWWSGNAKPATVAAVDSHRITVCDYWGRRTTHDAIELTYYFENSHPDPESFLQQLEAKIRGSLVAGESASPIERDDLERQQERWLAQAQGFAQANGIHIDGSGDQWVLTSTLLPDTNNLNNRSSAQARQVPLSSQSPPGSQETNDLDQNLLEALNVEQYAAFWQKVQQRGISDSDLKQSIGSAFGEFKGVCGRGQAWTVAGKKNPKFWNRIAAPCTPNPDLQGKALVQKVRSLLQLPYPSKTAPTAATGTVVNVKHMAHTLYIGRSNKTYKLPQSKWHNPYVVGKDGSLGEVLEKYLAYLLGKADLMAMLPELDGKVIGCWCADANTPLTINDPLRCHGQILLRARRGDYDHLNNIKLHTRLEFEQLSLPLF